MPRCCDRALRHEIALQGYTYGLRPVALSDAAFIVEVRSTSGQYLNRGASTVREQGEWIERYFARPDDYYFVVQRHVDGRAEGLVGIYDLDREARSAEWGRFVLRAGSLAAVESALLVYRCGFDEMALDRMVCRTLADNAQVVAFHDSCGLERAPATVMIAHDGEPRAAIEHGLHRDQWPAVRDRLDRLAGRLAKAHIRPVAVG